MTLATEATCRSCSAPVKWVRTVAGDKLMPVDPDPVPDGNLEVFQTPGGAWKARVVAAGQAGLLDDARYVSHFVTCPDSKAWKR